VASEALFSALEATMLSEEVIAKLVRDFYDLVAQIDNLHRLGSRSLTADDQSKLLASLAEHRMLTTSELGRGDFTLAGTGAMIAAQRAGLTLDAAERRQLEQAIMRAGIEAIKAAEERLTGDFTFTPKDPILAAKPANVTPLSSAIGVGLKGDLSTATLPSLPMQSTSATAAALSAKVPSPPSQQTVSTLTSRFLEQQLKGRLWDAQTVLQAGKSYKLFIELCGDHELQRYDRASAQRFKDTLQALPADYGKAAEFRGRSLLEIEQIDAERGSKAERLSTRTVKRHFSALSGFWRWSIKEKLVMENPFTGFTFPSALRANEQRDMWTEEELAALFATPVWAGCLSEGRRSTKGDLVIKDEKFWLPLIAVYSGLRQEEVAQLHIEDIRKVEGHLVFDINGRAPRKLKNRTAVRKVPVHSELIRLGFLEHINELGKAGADKVFPNLTPGGADQRLGHAFSKWFARYRRDVGLYRKGLDFHSFRHTATTLMQRAGIGIAVIDELTGHVTPGETARYSHGLKMDQLARAIEAISINIKITNADNST
jgi:integrase